jgi:hypothetical protein
VTSNLISTVIDGVPYAVSANSDKNQFEMVCIRQSSGITKAFQGDVTTCNRVLSWINANDHTLNQHKWNISPVAKYL